MVLQCHRCGSEEYKRNGSYKGSQRYRCSQCGGYFSDQPRKFDYATKQRVLDMYLNNVGIRKAARFTGASPATILKWIRAAHQKLAEQLRITADQVESGLPDIIEMDEIYTFIKKNGREPLSGLLIVGDKAALLRISSAKESPPPSGSIKP